MDVDGQDAAVSKFWFDWLTADELVQQKIIRNLVKSAAFDFIDAKDHEMRNKILGDLLNSYFRDLAYFMEQTKDKRWK